MSRSEFANEKRGMNHNYGKMRTLQDARPTGQLIMDRRRRQQSGMEALGRVWTVSQKLQHVANEAA